MSHSRATGKTEVRFTVITEQVSARKQGSQLGRLILHNSHYDKIQEVQKEMSKLMCLIEPKDTQWLYSELELKIITAANIPIIVITVD